MKRACTASLNAGSQLNCYTAKTLNYPTQLSNAKGLRRAHLGNLTVTQPSTNCANSLAATISPVLATLALPKLQQREAYCTTQKTPNALSYLICAACAAKSKAAVCK